ncbi:hypothetical protein DW66_3914 [Pseudomonas putida]|nr:hypothetical protein DW66_3914 [Pseudomonas putida]AJG12643.1 hypothetical protein RK21_01135 [Pseudomonas plecoglossicida]
MHAGGTFLFLKLGNTVAQGLSTGPVGAGLPANASAGPPSLPG